MKRIPKLTGLFLLAAGAVSLASCEKAMETGRGDLGVAPAGAAGAPPRRAPMKIEPQADRILREMGEYLKTAREFAFRAVITNDDVSSSGQKIQYGGATNVSVRRPDRFHTRYDGDERKSRTFYDGKTVTIYDAVMNVYAVAKVPAKIDDAIDLILDKFGFTVPIADLVYADPYAILIENVQSASLVGVHAVDGVPCNHLAFTQEAIDWQIWIADGPRPVPRKMVITYKNEAGSPQYTAMLSGWDFQPRLSDHAFTFHPPAGASPIEFLPIKQKESK